MPKQHTINLEAVIKAALDKNSEKIIDDFEKKITEPKEINIKTDEASKQVKKLSDEIEKEQKKHTQTSRKRNKTKTVTEQSTPKNADKYVQSTIYDKKGRPSTSHSYTYADGRQQSYNKNGKLTSEKQTVVDLQKAYSQLNKDVTEYYSLKTKEAKDKVATEDKQYVKGRISDLVDEMSANRKYIADAKKQGFYNDELEQKALNHFRRKANGYNTYIDEKNATIKAYGNDDNTAIRQGQRSKQLSNYAGQSTDAIERARTLDTTITGLEKELSSLVTSGASMDQIKSKFDECTSAGKEFKNVMTLVNSTMEKTSKKDTVVGDSNAAKLQNAIDKKVAQAKTLVSDSSIKQFDAKVEKLKSQYAGQDGSADVLSSLEKTVNTIHDKQASIKAELAKGSSGNLTQIASDADILNAKLNEVETTAKTLGTSLSKNLDGTTLQRTIDKIDNLVKNSDGFASKSQLEKLKTLRDSYTNSDSGITKAVNYDNSKIISGIEQEINARKKLAEVQKELQTGTYSATEAGYKNTLSKYDGQTSESLTRARESLKQFKEIREDFQKSLKDTNVSDLSDEEVERLSKNLQKMTEEEEKYKTAMKQVKAEETATLAPGVALRASNEMQSYINNNSKAWKKYKAQLEEVRDAYKNVTTEGQKLEVTGIYGMLQNVVMEIPSKVVSNVKEINDAQIELAKVASDASESQLSQYWDKAAESAKKYGATGSDVISSKADWSKLGYSLDDAKKLSDVTTLYQRVGDNMTQESASESLVSTLQGFNMQADEAESIVDKFNEVANNFAIGSDGIGEALQRSAASFNASHTSLSKSIALITGTRWYKLVQYVETHIKNIFNCHRTLYDHTPQYKGNYCMTV